MRAERNDKAEGRRGRQVLRGHHVRPFVTVAKPKRPQHAVNTRVAGLPGRTRSEKRANAKLAQQAWLADRRVDAPARRKAFLDSRRAA